MGLRLRTQVSRLLKSDKLAHSLAILGSYLHTPLVVTQMFSFQTVISERSRLSHCNLAHPSMRSSMNGSISPKWPMMIFSLGNLLALLARSHQG